MNSPGTAAPADLMAMLLDAICVVDARGCFISVSGACERIFGYTPGEMVGKPMLELVFPEDRARTLGAVDQIMSGQWQRHFENRYVRKDGTIVHISWSARWSEVDQVRVAVARDITERNDAELSDPKRSDAEALAAARQLVAAADAATAADADARPARRWVLSASPPRLIPPGFAPIALSAQDHTVMLALATGGVPVSREAIVRALGANFLIYDHRRMDTQMRRLRRKVKDACGLDLPLTTLRGAGYRFYDELEVQR